MCFFFLLSLRQSFESGVDSCVQRRMRMVKKKKTPKDVGSRRRLGRRRSHDIRGDIFP